MQKLTLVTGFYFSIGHAVRCRLRPKIGKSALPCDVWQHSRESRARFPCWCCPSQYTPAVFPYIVWCQQSDVLGHLTLLLQNRGKHGAWALSSVALNPRNRRLRVSITAEPRFCRDPVFPADREGHSKRALVVIRFCPSMHTHASQILTSRGRYCTSSIPGSRSCRRVNGLVIPAFPPAGTVLDEVLHA